MFSAQLNNLTELEKIAKDLLDAFALQRIFLFEGEIGSGKTTFIKSICKALNVDTAMSSPTYSLINEYLTVNNATVYHMDLYRLNTLEEAVSIGIEDYLFSGNYCFIEWPKLIDQLLPLHFVKIKIIAKSNETRVIEAQAITR